MLPFAPVGKSIDDADVLGEPAAGGRRVGVHRGGGYGGFGEGAGIFPTLARRGAGTDDGQLRLAEQCRIADREQRHWRCGDGFQPRRIARIVIGDEVMMRGGVEPAPVVPGAGQIPGTATPAPTAGAVAVDGKLTRFVSSA